MSGFVAGSYRQGRLSLLHFCDNYTPVCMTPHLYISSSIYPVYVCTVYVASSGLYLVKGPVHPLQAMKAQSGSSGISLIFL